jgi:ribosome-associated protein
MQPIATESAAAETTAAETTAAETTAAETTATEAGNPGGSPSVAELALLIAEAADHKKADDVVVLDLRGISTFTDFYVICSGSSEPQLKAIVEEIQDVLRKEAGVRARRVDGFPYSQWVVADFGEVIVHVFHESKRQHYALEDLWSDAPRMQLPEKAPPLRTVAS